jgi:ATP-binding protein involved in chromosome partitioning
MITKEQVLHALSHVDDPDLNKDIVTLNMVDNLSIDGNSIKFDVVLTTPACPMKDAIHKACVTAVRHMVSKEAEVEVNMTSKTTSLRDDESVLPGVKNIIAVGSGKGGVGKSTIAVNLALALHRLGAKVGLMDADIYGPSAPTMFGLEGQAPKQEGNKLKPLESMGIFVMSIGFLMEPGQAVIWRGPMASSAIRQFVTDVDWGELDYLIIDMPPGTGDIHLTITQQIPLTGSVVVTTPQKVAVDDAEKAIGMFKNEHINTPILGLVENMSYFVPEDNPSKKYFIFGKDGGAQLATKYKLNFLGSIPLIEDVCHQSDQGNAKLGAIQEKSFNELAGNLARKVAVVNAEIK